MNSIFFSAKGAAVALVFGSAVDRTSPPLYDVPKYCRKNLSLGAEKGRKPDHRSDQKGHEAAKACEDQLRQIYHTDSVTCTPSFPLGWSATVPLKATVIERTGEVKKLFVKYCDNEDGILRQVEKEYIWQKALWADGVTSIPRPELFDYTRRLFASEQIDGAVAKKSLFDGSLFRNQVADVLANIHVLDIDNLPGSTCLFLRPVQEAIDDGLKDPKLDRAVSQGLAKYARSLEHAVESRYDAATMARAVHGDMKAGNILLTRNEAKLKFTDFGMAHRGDPASDIGFFMADVHRPMADVASFVAHYANETSTDPTLGERAILHTAYNRLERYIRYQDWYADNGGAKQTMAALVLMDYQSVEPLLPKG